MPILNVEGLMQNTNTGQTFEKWLKAAVGIGSLLPLAMLIIAYLSGNLGFKPG
jgi:hypothetical protein